MDIMDIATQIVMGEMPGSREIYPKGTVVHAVQELGGTFVFLDKATADKFYDGEKGAVELSRGTYTLRADHTSLDDVADEAVQWFVPCSCHVNDAGLGHFSGCMNA